MWEFTLTTLEMKIVSLFNYTLYIPQVKSVVSYLAALLNCAKISRK